MALTDGPVSIFIELIADKGPRYSLNTGVEAHHLTSLGLGSGQIGPKHLTALISIENDLFYLSRADSVFLFLDHNPAYEPLLP
jgi:hypothetical protein